MVILLQWVLLVVLRWRVIPTEQGLRDQQHPAPLSPQVNRWTTPDARAQLGSIPSHVCDDNQACLACSNDEHFDRGHACIKVEELVGDAFATPTNHIGEMGDSLDRSSPPLWESLDSSIVCLDHLSPHRRDAV